MLVRTGHPLRALLIAACLAIAASPTTAHASILAVADGAALGGDRVLDWGVFGSDGEVLNTPETRSIGGLQVGVNSSFGFLARHDEVGRQWGFAAGSHLLTDAGTLTDTFMISFATPVAGLGARIQADPLGPFTSYLRLFSISHALLGQVTVAGNHVASSDSAVFLGARSSVADIAYAQFFVDYPSLPGTHPALGGGLAIDRLAIATQAPEPSSLALVVAALIASITLPAMGRRRRV